MGTTIINLFKEIKTLKYDIIMLKKLLQKLNHYIIYYFINNLFKFFYCHYFQIKVCVDANELMALSSDNILNRS